MDDARKPKGDAQDADDDVMMDISTQSRHLLARMAAISPRTSIPVKMERRVDCDEYIHKRTAMVRGIITRHHHMTSDLKRARDDMEKMDQEVSWFLRRERMRSARQKYRALERPEEFVSDLQKYSMEDFTGIRSKDKPPV